MYKIIFLSLILLISACSTTSNNQDGYVYTDITKIADISVISLKGYDAEYVYEPYEKLSVKPIVRIGVTLPRSLVNKNNLWALVSFELVQSKYESWLSPDNVHVVGSSHIENEDLKKNIKTALSNWQWDKKHFSELPTGKKFRVKLIKQSHSLNTGHLSTLEFDDSFQP